MTIEEIADVPANEYIPVQVWDSENYRMHCPFCGKTLMRHTNNAVGRDKMVWYDECLCKGADAAREHNAKF